MSRLGYRFLEDVAIADVAFEAWGSTLEEVFTASAEALMATMVEGPKSIREAVTRTLSLEAEAIDLLLFDYLQEFIYFKDAERLLLMPGACAVTVRDDAVMLSGVLVGEAIDAARHQLIVDVKAVTLNNFRVEESPIGWEAFVILDV